MRACSCHDLGHRRRCHARNCLSAMRRRHGVGACEAISCRGAEMRQRQRRRCRVHGGALRVERASRPIPCPVPFPSRSPLCQVSSQIQSLSLPLQKHSRGSLPVRCTPCMPPLPLTASPMRCTRPRRTPRVAWASRLEGSSATGVSLLLPSIVCEFLTHQVRPRKRRVWPTAGGRAPSVGCDPRTPARGWRRAGASEGRAPSFTTDGGSEAGVHYSTVCFTRGSTSTVKIRKFVHG